MNIEIKSAAFTGHRTSKLPHDLVNERLDKLIRKLKTAIYTLYQDGYTVFYSGMCQGVDLWAAKCVLELKRVRPEVKLICAIPFSSHASLVKGADKLLYDEILNGADESVILKNTVSRSEMPRAFNDRNRYMIEHSDALIAVYDLKSGQTGGTANTIKMAQNKGMRIILIDPTKI